LNQKSVPINAIGLLHRQITIQHLNGHHGFEVMEKYLGMILVIVIALFGSWKNLKPSWKNNFFKHQIIHE